MARKSSIKKSRASGKSLLERISFTQSKPKGYNGKEGYRVVNGRLVGENDVGALLRDAADTVRERKLGRSLRNHDVNRRSKHNRRTNQITNPRTIEIGTGNISDKGKNTINIRRASRHKNRKLILTTNTNETKQFLVIQNLSPGVNQANLKDALERNGNIRITQLKVMDLATGSATANIYLHDSSQTELERIQKLFNSAEIDGRTVQIRIASETKNLLSY